MELKNVFRPIDIGGIKVLNRIRMSSNELKLNTRRTGKGDAGYFSTGVGQSGTSGTQIKALWI